MGGRQLVESGVGGFQRFPGTTSSRPNFSERKPGESESGFREKSVSRNRLDPISRYFFFLSFRLERPPPLLRPPVRPAKWNGSRGDETGLPHPLLSGVDKVKT